MRMKYVPDWLPALDGAYLVGGCVRDLLLGRVPADYDVAVTGDPSISAQALAAAVGGRVIELGRAEFRLWRVAAAHRIIDLTPAAGGSIAADLRLRDFTVNALAIDTATGAIIDVGGGRGDLAAGIIRMVAASAFKADPVRLLRAFRFAAGLGFAIEPLTLAAIRREAGLIANSAVERIRDELFKLLACRNAHPHIASMAATGLLQALFAEAEPARIGPALSSIRTIEALLAGFASFPPDLAACLSTEFPGHRQALLKLAALLRCLGSRRTSIVDILARMRDRLRLSNRDTAHLEPLLDEAALPWNALSKTDPSGRADVRFFRRFGAAAPDLLLLALATVGADPSALPGPSEAIEAAIRDWLSAYFFRYRPRALAPAPISGNDLIREFGLTPSSRFKDILDFIAEECLARDGLTRAAALDLVKTFLKNAP
jgi:tRNA nucleotidyltransferase/poly(A) polymerase